MGWKTFNDRLALILLLLVIPGLWVAQGLNKIELPETVVGALIVTWTLIVQFYWRKKEGE
jgi:hypothetical protein